MKIEFVGGARTVTGSSFIVKNSNFTVMVDCGMFQGTRELRERNYLNLIYAPPQIDCLLLTHAHIDHSGLIPKLVKEGFAKPIYATKATCELATIMLPDSAHIQEQDAEIINKKRKKIGREFIQPIYTSEDAERCLQYFNPVHYHETVSVHPQITARFYDAGHILGSSFIEMHVQENNKEQVIIFSGDIGQKNQAIIKDPELPEYADILLIESTYGDRLHKSKEDTYNELKHVILDSYNKKGNIIIPAFAIERTQEILYSIAQLVKKGEIPPIPVYLDSPLATSATEIFMNNQDCFDEAMLKLLKTGDSPLDFPNLHFVQTVEESKWLNTNAKGAIIIAASGMCTAGRVKHHLLNNLYKPESSVIFVGYQAEGTLGRRIIDGAKLVKIYGENVAVRAKIYTIGGFSAHADKEGLLEWMSHIKNPNLKVFVIHGEEKASTVFAEEIRNRFGYSVYVPHWGEIIDLNTMKSEYAQYSPIEKTDNIESEIERISLLLSTIKMRYHKAKEEGRRINWAQVENDISDVRELVTMINDEL